MRNPCNHDFRPRLISTKGPIHVYGGTKASVPKAPVGATVLNLSGLHAIAPVTASGIEIPGVTSATIEMEVADFTAPRLTRDQWTALTAAIVAKGEPLVVCCVGEHGRTGTALAIILSEMGVIPDGADPVAWLRAEYCEEAVESQEQINYVERIAGRHVTVQPSHKWTYGTGSTWSAAKGWTPGPTKPGLATRAGALADRWAEKAASEGSVLGRAVEGKQQALPLPAPAELKDEDRKAAQDAQAREFASMSLAQEAFGHRRRSKMARNVRCVEDGCPRRRIKGTVFCIEHSPLYRRYEG